MVADSVVGAGGGSDPADLVHQRSLRAVDDVESVHLVLVHLHDDELGLNCLPAEPHERVLEVHEAVLAHLQVELCDLRANLVVGDVLVGETPRRVQRPDELLQVFQIEIVRCQRVELRPVLAELLEVLGLDAPLRLVSGVETLEDDADEEVQEDEADDELEHVHVHVDDHVAAPVHVGLDIFVADEHGVARGLVVRGVAANLGVVRGFRVAMLGADGDVDHNAVPVLTGREAQEHDEGRPEVSEVRVAVVLVVEADGGEELHAHDGEDEVQEHEQPSDVDDAGDRQNERVEELVQGLCAVHEAADSTYSEGADHGGDLRGRRTGVHERLQEQPDQRPDDDEAVEAVPVLLEVQLFHRSELHDHLRGEDEREREVGVLECDDRLRGVAAVWEHHHDRVRHDAHHDEVVEVFSQNDAVAKVAEEVSGEEDFLLRLHPRRDLLGLNPRLLLFREVSDVALCVLAHLVEVVDDDSDEQVHHEVAPDEDEHHVEDAVHLVRVAHGLHSNAASVLAGVHGVDPPLSRRELEEGHEGLPDVVEGPGEAAGSLVVAPEDVPRAAEALADVAARRSGLRP